MRILQHSEHNSTGNRLQKLLGARAQFRAEIRIPIDMVEETRSLWEQLDSNVEQWRRGRLAMILILIAIAAGQLAAAALSVFNDTVDTFVTSLITGWIGFF